MIIVDPLLGCRDARGLGTEKGIFAVNRGASTKFLLYQRCPSPNLKWPDADDGMCQPSTFAFAGFEQPRGYEYTRTSNPSRDLLTDLLTDTIAKLEGGVGAVMLASGMAAVDLVLAQLKPDELVIAPHDCYGGTYRLVSA